MPQTRKPPIRVLIIALAVVVGIGLVGAYSLRAVVEENTTGDSDAEYAVGDCRVFERELDMGSHTKYRKAKMCKQEDGSWRIVETRESKPDLDDTKRIEEELRRRELQKQQPSAQ